MNLLLDKKWKLKKSNLYHIYEQNKLNDRLGIPNPRVGKRLRRRLRRLDREINDSEISSSDIIDITNTNNDNMENNRRTRMRRDDMGLNILGYALDIIYFYFVIIIGGKILNTLIDYITNN